MLCVNCYSYITVSVFRPERPGISLYYLPEQDDRSVTVIPRNAEKDLYLERISAVHDALGIGCEFRETCPMPVQMEPDELVSIGLDIYEREQRMHPQAARAWRQMKAAAESARVILQARDTVHVHEAHGVRHVL